MAFDQPACSQSKAKFHTPPSEMFHFSWKTFQHLKLIIFNIYQKKKTESVLRYMAWHALLPVFSDLLDYVSNLCLVYL